MPLCAATKNRTSSAYAGLILRSSRANGAKGGIHISYINAEEILPAELVEQIRQYVEGKVIYIPRSKGRRPWGGQTGARAELDKRNEEIRRAHEKGVSVAELSAQYCLCCDSIQKILRKD